MNCQISNETMMKYFDGDLNDIENAQFKQHLKNCKKCSDEFESLNSVLDFIKTDETIEPPCDFEAGVMKKINDLESARKKRTEKTLFAIYWVATFMLAGLMVMFVLNMREAVLNSMALAGEHSGFLNVIYFLFRKFYEFTDWILNAILQLGIIIANLYSVILLAMGLALFLLIDFRGARKAADAQNGRSEGKK